LLDLDAVSELTFFVGNDNSRGVKHPAQQRTTKHYSRHKKGNNNSEVVITITLIAIKIAISLNETDLSRPSNAFFDSLMRTMSKGIIRGKLRIAIKAPPLPDFEAIPDIIVKTDAKLILPRRTESI
jgi:hypothetical protein